MRNSRDTSDDMANNPRQHRTDYNHHHHHHHHHRHQHQLQQQQQQHCLYDHDSIKKRIRYYTPQPVNHSFEETNKIKSINLADSKVRDPTANGRDSGYSSDQRTDSEIVTCFKGLFEPGRLVQGALRTPSLLRLCYSAAPNAEITRRKEGTRTRRLPELPDKNFTGERYHSGTHDVLKRFSSLSTAYAQNGGSFGLPRAVKQRPRLDAVLDSARVVNRESTCGSDDDSAGLSPTLISKAEAEDKNFLCDLYLRKGDECLEEFEFKKDAWSSSECMRHLDRCIEFYEMALKALGVGKDFENSRILLRTKQSKVILTKRNIWRLKASAQSHQSSNGTTERCREEGEKKGDHDHDGYRVDCRNGDALKSRDHPSVANDRPFRGDVEDYVAPNRTTPRALSATSLKSSGSGTSDEILSGWMGRVKMDSAVTVYHGKISTAFDSNGRDEGKNDSRRPGNFQKNEIKDGGRFSAAVIQRATLAEAVARKKLPRIPEAKSHQYVDITSRVGCQPFVKISFV